MYVGNWRELFRLLPDSRHLLGVGSTRLPPIVQKQIINKTGLKYCINGNLTSWPQGRIFLVISKHSPQSSWHSFEHVCRSSHKRWQGCRQSISMCELFLWHGRGQTCPQLSVMPQSSGQTTSLRDAPHCTSAPWPHDGKICQWIQVYS